MRAPGVLCAALVALSAALVVSSEQVVELAPIGGEDTVTLLEATERVRHGHQGGNIQMLNDADMALGAASPDSAGLEPGQQPTNGTEADADADAALTSANPFVTEGQGPATGSSGVPGDASDPAAGSGDDPLDLGPKRTMDQTEKEEKEDEHRNLEQKEKQNTIDEHLDFSPNAPLTLAGSSGIDTQCVVRDDSVEVSGRGEAACVFMSSLLVRPEQPVEIGFDIEFGNVLAQAEGGRHGGIFYGASQNSDSHANNPTVDWIDKAPGKGYRVYGNKDKNQLENMSPGPDPNKRWRITIMPDRTAEFSAGPKTWLQHFTPLMKGPYFGFFTTSGNMKISNVVVRPAQHRFKKNPTEEATHGLKINAEDGYGTGMAQLIYSETGGNFGRIKPKSMYLRGNSQDPKDFHTLVQQPGNVGGDICAGEDLHAGRFVELQSADGNGVEEDGITDSFHSSTKLFYIEEGKGRLKDRSVYIARGNLEAQEGSVIAQDGNVVASRRLLLGAANGFGKRGDSEDAEFWYAQVGKSEEKIQADTVYMRKGNLATEKGDIVAATDVVASEYLVLNEDSASGNGKAKMWYSAVGMEKFNSETVYVQNGDLSTFTGSVISKGDVTANRYLKINAKEFYGDGAGKMFYISQGSGQYTSNTMYVSSSIGTEVGDIESKKDLVTNRYLVIGTGDAKTKDGGGRLWYCSSVTSQTDEDQLGLKSKSLYLKSGDFRTEKGSIYSYKDLVATRNLFFSSSGDAFNKVKSARAEMWYAAADSGDTPGHSLYLRNGNFATETGSIASPGNLVAAKYVALSAMEGYGSQTLDIAQLYYSAKEEGGNTESTLYLKQGDLRVRAGSIVTSELGAEKIKINSMEGFGSGAAELFYVDSPVGGSPFQPKSLYVGTPADIRFENAYAKEHLITKHGVKVEAFPGFGSGAAELWFGKKGGEAGALNTAVYAPDTTYLREGDFATQTGDLAAELDIETQKGSFMVAEKRYAGALKVPKTQFAELWYSSTGSTPQIGSKSLYLRKGNFETQTGSIGASKNIRANPAEGSLKGAKVQLKNKMSCDTCEFGKILMLPGMKQQVESPPAKTPLQKVPDNSPKSKIGPSAVDEAMVLLDEGLVTETPAIDLEVALRKLEQRHQSLRSEEGSLLALLSHAKERLAMLESNKALLRN